MTCDKKNNFHTVIGIEVHAQLHTKIKMFSQEPTSYKKPANTYSNIIDRGVPGTLPSINKEAVHLAVKLGVLLQANISKTLEFDRKHYYYQDLPKGYQITQHRNPIIKNGLLLINNGDILKNITIRQAHLEEDTGKLDYNKITGYCLIDLNRCGIPLIEIVTEPIIETADEAVLYLKTLHNILVKNNICQGRLETGEFRCDINISIKNKDSTILNNKVELKNLNSFRNVKKAIEYEVERQIIIYRSVNQYVTPETRLYDEEKNITIGTRKKETEYEYKYTTEPNIPNFIICQNLIQTITNKPKKKKKKPTTKHTNNLLYKNKNIYINTFSSNELKDTLTNILITQKDKLQYYATRKKNILNFLLGYIIKKQPKINPKYLQDILEQVLKILTT
jgi:aspartyl-tRNA(Asn)/glutamyl-tRNA(Gln) amidotransferase subunit B